MQTNSQSTVQIHNSNQRIQMDGGEREGESKRQEERMSHHTIAWCIGSAENGSTVKQRESKTNCVSGNEQHICTNLLNDNHNILCYMQLRDKTHT